MTMEGKLHQVTPFGHPRVLARLQLSEAFRSLLRPSSPVGTKAFTISPSVPHIEESPGDPQLKSFRVRISLFVCLILVCLSLVLEIVFFPQNLVGVAFARIAARKCSYFLLLRGCQSAGLLPTGSFGKILRFGAPNREEKSEPVPERASGSGA